ncbi:MAG TPA: glycosyltransferase family 2 protein [Blastocatellia bacterium]|jgi:glycosyltransferase involved in cell wall biosynthesis|nr:glycosyltransferase family 2 protein [Blastocatellia bacterium]
MPHVSVVIPALNEEEVIAQAVQAIPPGIAAEIIVVDNGSVDGTSEQARRAGAIVVSEPVRGYGRACRAGVRAVSQDCEIIVQMDADLSDDPSEMPILIEPIVEEGYDLVLGSRMLGRRESGSMSPAQVFGSRLASLLIRLFYGVRYTDMGPFRAIRKSALDSLDMKQETYGWSIEMQTKAAARGLRVKEVPVTWRNRAAGQSKVAGTLSGSVRAGARIIWTILNVVFGETRD